MFLYSVVRAMSVLRFGTGAHVRTVVQTQLQLVLLQALYSHGNYAILDIRNNIEVEKYGKIPNDRTSAGSVCIPYKVAKKRFEDGQVKVEEEDNPYFLEDVEYEFPDKSTKLIIMDFDGSDTAMEALDTLFEVCQQIVVPVLRATDPELHSLWWLHHQIVILLCRRATRRSWACREATGHGSRHGTTS